MQPSTTRDLRINGITALDTPAEILAELPAGEAALTTVRSARHQLQRRLAGEHDRLVVVMGPCSIHDREAALEYAGKLAAERKRFAGELDIIMRVYFEKPRTTVGWKGLINDPDLDGSFRIDKGLRMARGLLRDINAMGVPAGCEFLDTISPQYLADLVSWGAIGARTTESQVHRELVSGLSCPIGFKNGTGGNVKVAIDAVRSATQPHHFLSVTREGRVAIVATEGNRDCHVILRGGKQPNHDADSVAAACRQLAAAGRQPQVMIDASHANSGKNPDNMPRVVEDIAEQIESGADRVFGVMIESHLVGGRQDLVAGKPLVYGQSITDGCMDWDGSVRLLERLARAVQAGREQVAAA
ncbi:MAG TPA: 3-deoxy-7-phosphoheptulonate synthase [Oleiagrimonas sp.]|nr:3-deoxy-7-phosphoheptulonate synthase [Oleiagrimonas sp.]